MSKPKVIVSVFIVVIVALGIFLYQGSSKSPATLEEAVFLKLNGVPITRIEINKYTDEVLRVGTDKSFGARIARQNGQALS
ncbi:hypothetical protein FHS18_005207 [Paenibacillus phyllosphaerae]|uniref:Uncharacterized protein n=1 Tax=Paenibacillus phyllosphaerae TaxID=274593 RepID=A0A7W5B282_9BACL|nr:hypothetical protein [Paenibacillus phyllosphaerae]MBB3113104.1 hypothetical protein [Paenibacillus phyllosphaerae]